MKSRLQYRRRKTFNRILSSLLIVGCLLILFSCQGATHLPASERYPTSSPTESVPALPQETVETGQTRVIGPVDPPPPVSRDRLLAHLSALSTERHNTRQRQLTRDYIEAVLRQNGWNFEEQTFDNGINVIAHRRDRLPHQREILIGAHYDSVRGTPGADDNATGVAATLELGQVFQSYPAAQNLTLAFFDLEENGAIGSGDYVQQSQNIDQLNGAIILEMLGYTCNTPQCQGIPPELDVTPPSDIGDFLSVIGDTEHPYLLQAFRSTASPLELLALDVPFKGLLTPILLRSDHSPFWLKGKGAVMVSDTAFLRNPHYHRASDTVATLDLEFLTQSTELVSQAAASLLNQIKNPS